MQMTFALAPNDINCRSGTSSVLAHSGGYGSEYFIVGLPVWGQLWGQPKMADRMNGSKYIDFRHPFDCYCATNF
jgi:hypothetical protein